MKNPEWTKDELILALDLYFRVNPRRNTKNHPEIIGLSKLLNELPIHPKHLIDEKFRTTNSNR